MAAAMVWSAKIPPATSTVTPAGPYAVTRSTTAGSLGADGQWTPLNQTDMAEPSERRHPDPRPQGWPRRLNKFQMWSLPGSNVESYVGAPAESQVRGGGPQATKTSGPFILNKWTS